MIDWSKYFDRIYCIHFVQYTKRKQLLEFELNRVGILNSGIFQYQFTYNNFKFNQYIKEVLNIPCHFYRYISVALGHYEAIRDAYNKDYNRILIIEDDVRFLRDLNKIEQILNNRPQNTNLILYDKFIYYKYELKQFMPINNYYSTFKNCWSAACYQLDRKGMQKLISLMETELKNPDNYFFEAEKYLNDIIYCCSKTNMAVQAQYKISQIILNNISKEDMYLTNVLIKGYKKINIDFDNYMMRKDGSPYYSGDYIIDKEEKKEIELTDEQNKQIIPIDKPIQPIQMNICLAVTWNQIDKLMPILYSLLKYSKSKFNVYIMIDKYIVQNYEAYFKPFINDRMKIKLISSRILDENLNPKYSKRLTNLTYAKLVIPTLFPNLDRILYLDWDAIILKEGIENFYNIDFRNNYVAVAEDLVEYNKIEGYKCKGHYNEQIIFKDSKCYFNAGIMLFNIPKIIKDNKDKELMSYLNEKPRNFLIMFEDQSLLNLAFKNTALRVNPIFNNFCPQVTNCFSNLFWKKQIKQKFNIDDADEFFNNVVIAHFGIACLKPWNHFITYRDMPQKINLFNRYNELYNETLEMLNEYYME